MAAGELRWDIEPSNGRSCFFTRESYEKYCLGPTLAELLLVANKPPPAEPTQKQSEASSSQAPVPDSQPVVPSSTKHILPFPEPRVPYPRFSSLTACEQDAYVKLMIKFHNKKKCNVFFGQVKDYNNYESLKSKSSFEVPEFQKFLQNAARSCAEDYNVLCANADLYVQEMLKICQTYVKNYPPIYTVHEITSILGGKFIPDLTFKLEKCLLKMGSVKFAKLTFPSDSIPLPVSYKTVSQMVPPVKKASHVHVSVISDPNVSKLASKYCPQVVLTSQALFALLNNHAPGYSEQWEIPLCVKTGTDTDGKPCKVVYIDSPLPKKELSTRERSQMFHEVVLDKFMIKNSMIPMKIVFLDREEMDLHVKEHNRNLIQHEDKEIDFTSDVTALETFCFESPELSQTSHKTYLQDRLQMEKQIINSTSASSHLLSRDLMAMQEDSSEYTVEPEENCAYKMFSLGDMLLIIKASVHAAKSRAALKKSFKCQIPVFVLAKVDYQTCYGVESLTDSERCRLWTESLLHSKCELFVGHVDALTSTFFMLEEIAAENVKESMNNFNPANCLNSLRHILKWVTGLQDGSYLLSHVSGDSSVCLYKSAKDKQRGAYNLHDAHCNAPKPPSSLSVPWVPLNPNLLLKYHIQHGRPPCTFPPAPEMDPGIQKPQLNQPRKAPCKEKTKVSPATNASKVPKKKGIKGQNKWKPRLKAQKTKAALQENE